MRYLTQEGRAFFRKTARTLSRNGLTPDLILTSPLVRAVQTADILAEALRYEGSLQVADGLEPGCGMKGIASLLGRFRDVGEVVMVGHEPDLGDAVGGLLGLKSPCALKKGRALALLLNSADLRSQGKFLWIAGGKKLSFSLDWD